MEKIYSHYTFEQSAFKKDFVLSNQRERKNAKSDIERDFFKLMNNANFGVDCRNNATNSSFEPIIDELNEVSYLKNIITFLITEFLVLSIAKSLKKKSKMNLQRVYLTYQMIIHLRKPA